MKKKKPNTLKRVLTLTMIVSYLLVLLCFIIGNMGAVLVCFIVSSCITLAYNYSKNEEEVASIELEELEELRVVKEKLEKEQEEKEKLRLEYNEKLDEKQKELDRYLEENESSKESLESKEDEILKMKEELQKIEEQLQGSVSDEYGLIPPLRSGEKDYQRVDLIKIINSTIDELTFFAQKVGVAIRLNSADESLFVDGNEERFRILFRNIIDNSIKYMNTQGTLVITVSTIEEQIFVVLKDNGEGLDAAETEHIFELNFQGSNRISGNGLGLSQAKSIVEHYDGKIYAKSNAGNGMGIYIELPKKQKGDNQ